MMVVTISEHDARLVVAVLQHLISELDTELAGTYRAAPRSAMHWTKREAIDLRNRLDLELTPKKPEPKKGAA